MEAMSIQAQLPKMNSFTIYNTNYADTHKKHPTSMKFMQRFTDMHIEGSSKFIQYFEPKLQELENDLQHYKDPAEEAWVKSLEAEIARDRAQLELLKAHRMTYGAMAVKFREYENNRKSEEDKLTKMKSELKKQQEDCKKLHKTMRDQKLKLSGKINRLESMVLTSTERIQEKANMITKMGFNYDLNHTMARKKISELQKKSGEMFVKYHEIETDRSNTILTNWKETLLGLENNLKEFRKSMGRSKGGSHAANEVNIQNIVEFKKQDRKRDISFQNFQTCEEMLRANQTCWEFMEEQKNILEGSNEHCAERNAGNLAQCSARHGEQDKPKTKNTQCRDSEDESDYDTSDEKEKEKDDSEIEIKNTERETLVEVLQIEDLSDDEGSRFPETIRPCWTYLKAPEEQTQDKGASKDLTQCSTTAKKANESIPYKTRTLPEPPKALREQTNKKEENGKGTNPSIMKYKLKVTEKKDGNTIISKTVADNGKQKHRSAEEKNGENEPMILQQSTTAKLSIGPGTVVTRSLPAAGQSGMNTNVIPDFTAPSVKAGKTTPEEPFNQYSAKIRESFRKEVTGQMSVKKGEKVKIIGRPENGFVLAKKKDKLGLKKKQGLIPTYTFDSPV